MTGIDNPRLLNDLRAILVEAKRRNVECLLCFNMALRKIRDDETIVVLSDEMRSSGASEAEVTRACLPRKMELSSQMMTDMRNDLDKPILISFHHCLQG